jgi:hypothetical protein
VSVCNFFKRETEEEAAAAGESLMGTKRGKRGQFLNLKDRE